LLININKSRNRSCSASDYM